MKALSVTLILAGLASAAAAQTPNTLQQNWNSQKLQMLLKTDTGLNKYFSLKSKPVAGNYLALPQNTVATGFANAGKVYSRMPVAHLKSTDAMPVAALSNTSAMPNKHIAVIDPLAAVAVALNP